MTTADTSARSLIVRGIKWTTAYQIFEAALGFGAMLVLVRVIAPADYGRVGVAVGLLGLLNSFNSGVFAAQALQLPHEREPDWSSHWSAGLYVQATLIVACQLLAALCWLKSDYRPVAPLLHVAAVGLLIDWPAHLRMNMLRRALNFRRLKTLLAVSNVTSLAVSFAVALAGGGAYALVLGANVSMPVPFAVDLLLVQGWRPRAGWWRWPGWTSYRPALVFGFQQAGSTLLLRSRAALEGLVLPGAVGYVAIGFLSRARALFSVTAGRPGSILAEIAYPILPRYAADPARYAQKATQFAQALMLALVPGALYVGLEGRGLSRLLYGERWVAADPLILPAAAAGLGFGVFGIGSCVLLASNRLWLCTMLEALTSCLVLPAIALAWTGHGVAVYAWAIAGAQLASGMAALGAASPLMAKGWIRSSLLPPVLSSLPALGAVLALGHVWPERSPGLAVLADTAVYGLVLCVGLRAMFPEILTMALSLTPGGIRLGGWLRLPRMAAGSPSGSRP